MTCTAISDEFMEDVYSFVVLPGKEKKIKEESTTYYDGKKMSIEEANLKRKEES